MFWHSTFPGFPFTLILVSLTKSGLQCSLYLPSSLTSWQVSFVFLNLNHYVCYPTKLYHILKHSEIKQNNPLFLFIRFSKTAWGKSLLLKYYVSFLCVSISDVWTCWMWSMAGFYSGRCLTAIWVQQERYLWQTDHKMAVKRQAEEHSTIDHGH